MLLVLLLAALQVNGGDAVGRWSSYLHGQRFDFIVRWVELEQTPLWLESDQNPPLPPRRAIAAARAELARLVPAPEAWQLSEVQLQPVGGPDRWVYLVGFSEPPPGPLGGIGPMPLQIVVLMNGVAIEPTLTPSPAGQNER
jgi:hypothetical protein